jgi:hypothetical protein
MTVWEIIDIALRRQGRNQKWLAGELHVKPQAVNAWKKDGVPQGTDRRREIARVLKITLDQLEGLEPLPWDKGWPFPDVEQERFYGLTPAEREEVQRKVREAIEEIERARKGGAQPSRNMPPDPEPKATPQPRHATPAQHRTKDARRGPDLPPDDISESDQTQKQSKAS